MLESQLLQYASLRHITVCKMATADVTRMCAKPLWTTLGCWPNASPWTEAAGLAKLDVQISKRMTAGSDFACKRPATIAYAR